MRPRRSDPPWFSLLVTLYVVVFVLQIVTLLFVGGIALPIQAQSGIIVILENKETPLVISRPGLAVRADRATPEELRKYYPILSQELSRYSKTIFQSIPLRRIVLCARLTIDGKSRAGLALESEGTILLNVTPPEWLDEESIRRVIHHELFHVMDVILTPNRKAADTWAIMNPAYFTYGGNDIMEALEITNQSPDGRTEVPGLLNYYSMVSVQEDRAELFSYMIVRPDYLKDIADTDKIILTKVVRIKRELLSLTRDFEPLLK